MNVLLVILYLNLLAIKASRKGTLIPLIAACAIKDQTPWEDSSDKIEKLPNLLEGSIVFILPNTVEQSESDILVKSEKLSQIDFFLCLPEDKCPYQSDILTNIGFYKTSEKLSVGIHKFDVWRVRLCREFKMLPFSNAKCKIVVFAKESQMANESVRRNGVVYDSVATQEGAIVWNDKSYFLTEMPEFLEGSHLFRVPFNLKRQYGDFRIHSKKDSIIYIVQNATNRAYNPTDLDTKKFRRLKGKTVVTSGCTLDEVYYYKGTGNEIQDIEIELGKPTTLDKFRLSIFIKKGKIIFCKLEINAEGNSNQLE